MNAEHRVAGHEGVDFENPEDEPKLATHPETPRPPEKSPELRAAEEEFGNLRDQLSSDEHAAVWSAAGAVASREKFMRNLREQRKGLVARGQTAGNPEWERLTAEIIKASERVAISREMLEAAKRADPEYGRLEREMATVQRRILELHKTPEAMPTAEAGTTVETVPPAAETPEPTGVVEVEEKPEPISEPKKKTPRPSEPGGRAAEGAPSVETSKKERAYEISGLVTPEDIRRFLATPEFQRETDPQKRQDLVAYWLSERRLENGFAIPDIDVAHQSFNDVATHEYAVWDAGRAQEILRSYAGGVETPKSPPVTLATPETKPTPPPIRPDQRIRAGIVDIERKVDEIARHRAEEQLQRELRGDFGERRDGRPWWQRAGRGTMNLFRRTARHWGEEGYRQLYIQRERQRLLRELSTEHPNLFTAEGAPREDTRAESNAILNRFLSEYEGMVRDREGEQRQELVAGPHREALQHLVADFVNGDINETAFHGRKQLIVDAIRADNPGLFARERATVDNLLDIAQDLRAVHDHSERIAGADLNIDFQLGQARSAIKDEAHLRSFDRLVKRIQRNPVLGKIISPATLGFATSLAVRPLMSVLRMGAQAANIAAPGAGAAIGGTYAGVRRSMEVKGDVAHVRRGAAMGYEVPAGARRLERMREFVYDQASVGDLTAALGRNLESLRNTDLPPAEREARLQDVAGLIADTEARMDAGVATRHDFLRYEDPTRIEQGRLNLLRSMAEAKVQLRAIAGASPDRGAEQRRIDTLVANRRRTREQELRTNVQETNRRFGRFKNVEVAKAVAYGAATGFVAGALAQWATAEFREHVLHQKNVPQSTIGKLWGKITGHKTMDGTGTFDHPPLHLEKIGEHGQINLGQGYHVVQSPDHPDLCTIVDAKGQAVTSPFSVDQATGKIPESVRAELLRQGWIAGENTEVGEHVTEQLRQGMTPDEYAAKSKDLLHIARGPVPHLDSDTPLKADSNEVRLDWGGVHNTGIDEKGNYVFDVGRMLREGSFKGDLHVDPQALIKDGQLRLLLSMTRETQKTVFEVMIDQDGMGRIAPNSDAGRILFSVVNGHADYHGKFAEAAQILLNQDGNPIVDDQGELHVRALATYVGEELKHIPGDQITPETVGDPSYTYDLLKPTEQMVERPWETPPVIPLSRRNALEGMTRIPEGDPYYYDSYLTAARKQEFTERRSETLNKNRDAKLDEHKEVAAYLDKLDPTYRAELEGMDTNINQPMDRETRMVVAIPARGEAENLRRTLEHYTQQVDRNGQPIDPKAFEVIVLLNRPDGSEDDDSSDVIEQFQQDHPEMRVHYASKVFRPEEAKVGNARKYANDLALLRSTKRREQDGRLILVSNDADAESISPVYLDRIRRAIDEHERVDAVTTKVSFDSLAYEKLPFLHVSRRLMEYLDAGLRHAQSTNRPRTIGASAAITAEMYAGIGGYNPRSRLGEDLELGEMIRAARAGTDRKPIAYINAAEVVTSPRRQVVKTKDGVSVMHEYDDFTSNERIRDVEWRGLVEEGGAPYEVRRFEAEASALLKWTRRDAPALGIENPDEIFRRAMGFLGVRYKVTLIRERDGIVPKVVVEDQKELLRHLSEYPERRRREQAGKEKRHRLMRTPRTPTRSTEEKPHKKSKK